MSYLIIFRFQKSQNTLLNISIASALDKFADCSKKLQKNVAELNFCHCFGKIHNYFAIL